MRASIVRSIVIVWSALAALMLPVMTVSAEEDTQAVYSQLVAKPVSTVFDKLYISLEDALFFFGSEPGIGVNLSSFSDKWGEEYNRNNISAIRSMVFCNGWYANKVSNLDPYMLGFCPLHLTLFERDGKTTVLFNRPGKMAQNSPARDLLMKIENEVIDAIKQGLM